MGTSTFAVGSLDALRTLLRDGALPLDKALTSSSFDGRGLHRTDGSRDSDERAVRRLRRSRRGVDGERARRDGRSVFH